MEEAEDIIHGNCHITKGKINKTCILMKIDEEVTNNGEWKRLKTSSRVIVISQKGR